jgi:hypothetical protein
MKSNSLALWAGISAFFATLLGVGVIDIFNPTDQVRLVSGIVVGSDHCRSRLLQAASG